MKKIFFVFALLLAFSVSVSAQEKKAATSQESAKKDAVELANLVKLSPEMTENFLRLFEMKYQILEDKSLTAERKSELENVMDAKIRATLDAKQMSLLEGNKELFDRLKR
ncbi:hypothetical protein OX283_008880 [Flavobacterium sp. SUN052]|uniref:hypothetical protein n=1 Tax=Flavobacterium sp. SUN052 TaxID=3002441 RepID=UPI00237E2C10|nr:hypothetical protein [Flavobacterium sp. SUN052]MEC4004770.1 hypothetical protein [Flavobacterium sp. SUN052]